MSNVTNMLYKCSEASQAPVSVTNVVSGGNRWDRLLNDRDDTRVWKAIDWQGKFQDGATNSNTPSNDEFKTYYETFCNPDLDEDCIDSNHSPYVPILDDAITVDELSLQIQKMRPEKASGVDGVSPWCVQVPPCGLVSSYHCFI